MKIENKVCLGSFVASLSVALIGGGLFAFGTLGGHTVTVIPGEAAMYLGGLGFLGVGIYKILQAF